jgi:hypothetical protein
MKTAAHRLVVLTPDFLDAPHIRPVAKLALEVARHA